MKKSAPFLTTRWWVVHALGAAAVYAAGVLIGGR